MKGLIFILSGPSGAGKTSICRFIISSSINVKYIISATSRPKRDSERDEIDYLFFTNEEFKNKIEQNYFLEWAEVHGFLYGTPRVSLENFIKKGKICIMDIDIQGAENIRKIYPEAISIFIIPPSWRILKNRLYKRGTENDKIIKKRLLDASNELKHIKNYDYMIVNDILEEASKKITCIITAEKCKMINTDLEEDFNGKKKLSYR